MLKIFIIVYLQQVFVCSSIGLLQWNYMQDSRLTGLDKINMRFSLDYIVYVKQKHIHRYIPSP